MTPTVSIVIPTYKRDESLKRLLNSIKNEVKDLKEIIVVVQGKNEVKIHDKYVKLVHLEKPSTAHAMNVGAQMATGELLLFFDDDVTVNKRIVANHAKIFKTLQVAATVGRVITDGQRMQPNRTDTGRISILGRVSDGFSSKILQETDTSLDVIPVGVGVFITS